MLGKRCLLCGLYIKFFQRASHERWHADQVCYILKLLCNHCASEHGKPHKECGLEFDKCRCACNKADQ